MQTKYQVSSIKRSSGVVKYQINYGIDYQSW